MKAAQRFGRFSVSMCLATLVVVLAFDQGCGIALTPPPAATPVPTTVGGSTDPLAPTTTAVNPAMQVTITQATTSIVSGYVSASVDPATGLPAGSPITVNLISLAASPTSTNGTPNPAPLLSTTASTATTAPGVPSGAPAFVFQPSQVDPSRTGEVAAGAPLAVSAQGTNGAQATSTAFYLQQ